MPGLMVRFIWLIKGAWADLPIICHSALYEYKELPPHERPFDDFVEKSSELTKLKVVWIDLFTRWVRNIGRILLMQACSAFYVAF
jgi:hypothetical protein